MVKRKKANKRVLPGAIALYRPSKKLVRSNIVSFTVYLILPGIYTAFLGFYIGGYDPKSFHELTAIPSVAVLVAIAGVISLLALPIVPYLSLQSAKNRKVSVVQAFNEGVPFFWRLILMNIVIGVLVVVGLLLFIVPGLIVIRRYFLGQYYLIDQNLPINEAMSQSAKETKNHSWAIWGIIGFTALLSLTRVIPLFGALISIYLGTMYAAAPAMRYFQIRSLANKEN